MVGGGGGGGWGGGVCRRCTRGALTMRHTLGDGVAFVSVVLRKAFAARASVKIGTYTDVGSLSLLLLFFCRRCTRGEMEYIDDGVAFV